MYYININEHLRYHMTRWMDGLDSGGLLLVGVVELLDNNRGERIKVGMTLKCTLGYGTHTNKFDK